MITFVIVVGIAYLLRSFVFRIGAHRAANPHRVTGTAPFVSVIVAARNEESNIGRCVESLVKQDYPLESYEILVMDDGSTDGTAAIVDEFAARFPNVRCVDVHDESSHLRGKARAVAQGIDIARGEILATTDADCKVGEQWLSTSVSYFEPRTGLVAGFTLQESRSTFGAVQALDWSFLQSMASAGFGLRRPLGCIGNNLFFRRTAYDLVGGYRGFPFSITEDFALLRAIEHAGESEFKYPVNPATLVWSEPCDDWATLWRQKRRWAHGGKQLGLRGYLVLISSMSIDSALFLTLLLGAWPLFLLVLASRWIGDFILIAPTLSGLKVGGLLRYFPAYACYALAYEVALPFGMMKREVLWKGRKF